LFFLYAPLKLIDNQVQWKIVVYFACGIMLAINLEVRDNFHVAQISVDICTRYLSMAVASGALEAAFIGDDVRPIEIIGTIRVYEVIEFTTVRNIERQHTPP